MRPSPRLRRVLVRPFPSDISAPAQNLADFAIEPANSTWLLRIAVGVLGDQAEAEDAVQEVYFKTWRKGTAHIRKPLRVYLASAVKKEALKRRRKRQTRDIPVAPATIRDQQRLPPSVEGEALAGLEREALRRALDELTPREQTVVTGREAGLTYTELAQDLGVVRTRVKQIETEALARLARLLRSWGTSDE